MFFFSVPGRSDKWKVQVPHSRDIRFQDKRKRSKPEEEATLDARGKRASSLSSLSSRSLSRGRSIWQCNMRGRRSIGSRLRFSDSARL